MRSFNEYALSQDYKSVREELANHLIESNVDVATLNQVFDIINRQKVPADKQYTTPKMEILI
jgi:hypothetical protein